MIVRHAKHRERERWPCRKTWIKTRRVLVEKVGGGDYSKILEIFMGIQDCQQRGSRGPKQQLYPPPQPSQFDCPHVLQSYPSTRMCMKVQQSESHKVRRHDTSGSLLVLLVSPGKLHLKLFSIYLLYN